MNFDWQRVRQVLAEAAALTSPAERAAYLEDACRGDDRLRTEVEQLLEAHDEAGAFLEQPALSLSEAVTGLPPTERIGDQVGPYKLLQPIGEGGCGVVYLAAQEHPIRRQVALKVIKLGMDTRAVIARFEAERQALALMDHPNIARVLDAGATDTGRPYFVMELVQGIKITDYCDQHQLSTRARLNLFVQVCRALQHAHQKGIIHRDIKPSNILVTLQDGQPVPKVIDFGIAKATDRNLTDTTLFTTFEQFIGTPAYMSPEQAQPSTLDIDTRSDIYSLGVLLYELLTGFTPFDQKELASAGLDEMRRIIREEDPKRPSTRLSTLAVASQTTVARCRHAEPPQLIHSLQGDLDWIVMRCLEKDRTRRYETANSLAEDVLRHLSDDPVSARPPSRLYRFQKLVRRNKKVFATGALVALALVLGLGFSLWTLAKERAVRRQALAAERKAQQVAQFLKEMLQGVGPSVAMGRDTTMLREILDKTAERVGKDLKGQPEVEAELRTTLGEVYEALGKFDQAEGMFREALALRRALWGNLNTNVASALDHLSEELLTARGELVESAALAEQAFAIQTNLLGPENVLVAASLRRLGQVRYLQGSYDDAGEFYRRSLAMTRRLLGNGNREVVQCLIALSDVSRSLGITRPVAGRLEEAETYAREALAILARLGVDERTTPEVAIAEVALSNALWRQGKSDEAVALARKVLALDHNLLGSDHPGLVAVLHSLAQALVDGNQLDEAEALIRDALVLSRRRLGNQHRYTAFCLEALGGILRKTSRLAEAEGAFREAMMIWKNIGHENEGPAALQLVMILRDQHQSAEAEALWRAYLATARRLQRHEQIRPVLFYLGQLLREEGKSREAEPPLREALELSRQSSPSEPDPETALLLVQTLVDQGRSAEAQPYLDEALQTMRKHPGSSALARACAVAGEKYAADGNWVQAEAMAREGLEICRRIAPETEVHQWLAWGVANTVRQQGKWAEAEPFCRECVTTCVRLWPRNPERWQGKLTAFALVLETQGKLAEVELLYRDTVTKAARLWPHEFKNWEGLFTEWKAVLQRQCKTNEVESVTREIQALVQDAASLKLPPEGLSRLGDALRQQATWLEADAVLASLLETTKESPLSPANADEFALQAMKLAALQAWFGRDAQRTALSRVMLRWLGDHPESSLAEHIAKAICLRSPAEPQLASSALALARRAAELAQTDSWLRWYQLTLGMAEYRNGNYAEAARILSVAELPGPNTWRLEIRVRSARVYRAMSLFRQGQRPDARRLLTLAETDMKLPPAAGQWPLANDVDVNDLILWLAHREATELLKEP